MPSILFVVVPYILMQFLSLWFYIFDIFLLKSLFHDTLFWFCANQSLLLKWLFVILGEKQFLVWIYKNDIPLSRRTSFYLYLRSENAVTSKILERRKHTKPIFQDFSKDFTVYSHQRWMYIKYVSWDTLIYLSFLFKVKVFHWNILKLCSYNVIWIRCQGWKGQLNHAEKKVNDGSITVFFTVN